MCGVCVCDHGKAGERCECDLNHYGISSADDLINQCREFILLYTIYYI